MSKRGGGGGGGGGGGRGRGRGGGSVGAYDDPRGPPPAFHGQRGGGGGGGRGGGSVGAYDDPRGPPPALHGQRGGGGGGGRGGGRGRGRSVGLPAPQAADEAYHPAQPPTSPAMVTPAAAEVAQRTPPSVFDVASSSTSEALALSQELRAKMTVADPIELQPSAEAAAAAGDVVRIQPPVSSKSVRNAPRPGYGTVGRKCIVKANHFLVRMTERDLCHYDVTITPESTSRAFNRVILSQLVSLHKSVLLGGRTPAYDGRKSLYTAGALPFESKLFLIKLPGKDPLKGEREFRVNIRFVGRADFHNLQQFLAGRQLDVPQETIQILDVALRELPSINYVSVFRSFYSPSLGARGDVGDGVEFWKGYYQSLRPTQMGLSLNIDISSTSFYKPINVVEFVAEYLYKDISRLLSDTDVAKLKRALRGVKVEAVHNKEKCIRYKITGISSVPINQLKFPVEEQSKEMYVVQYFKEKYNCTLRYGNLPALQAGTEDRPKYLPMEVCKIVEGQRYSRKLNDRQVTAILKATCQRPQVRESSILEMVQFNNYKDDKLAKEFGLQVNSQLTAVEARILPPPKLKYHDSGKDKSCSPNVGQWNMISKKLVDGAKVDCWACLCFSNRVRLDAAYNFCGDLVYMCNQIGMIFNSEPLIEISTSRPDRLDSALREVYECSFKMKRRIQLLIVILPDISGSYGKIKRICETDLGLVTQCCQPKNVTRNNKQYMENLALKINVKVGGRNTVLEDAIYRKIPIVTELPTIIFGADVTHPPPGDDTMSSIAAVVASMDWPEFSKYRGLVSAQHHREEIIHDLYRIRNDPQRGIVHEGLIRELLISYYQATKQKPKRIIFFRDGVSEGQFSQVLLYEVDAIRKACASLEEGYLPTVTFVVVQKRHHTRLFPESHGRGSLTDKSGNILPGTVVDRTICHPTEFDFYLCSHAGIQGTSKPAHYHVLLDENKFTADIMQMLVNNLCYTYARCTRSVSIVPPAYYAHLAAFRARYYMEDLSESASSAGGGGRNRQAPTPPRQLPPIHDNVKQVMFYC